MCGSSMCFLVADYATPHSLAARMLLWAVLGGAATGSVKVPTVCPHWVVSLLMVPTLVGEFSSPTGRFAFPSTSNFIVATLVPVTSMVVTNRPIILHVVGVPVALCSLAGMEDIASNQLSQEAVSLLVRERVLVPFHSRTILSLEIINQGLQHLHLVLVEMLGRRQVVQLKHCT